ncbi:hypothetical protein PAECIP111892_03559 [Paenibacillus auburnensis]|uniref:Uncharacterized protein n=1 Tax=Paenibacillus auburnensis TaxID=2905649 RepID=A0ABN8GKT6_9BACL|nr:hypothetical protein PAECIP111892_03559 [Paenibacillus auburnensis]
MLVEDVYMKRCEGTSNFQALQLKELGGNSHTGGIRSSYAKKVPLRNIAFPIYFVAAQHKKAPPAKTADRASKGTI